MLYAIGGDSGTDKYKAENSGCLNNVERYNVDSEKWEDVIPMNEERRGLNAVVLPDGIYVMGGFNGFEHLQSLEKYDIENEIWIDLSPMNQPRSLMAAVASPDCRYIYVIGGTDGHGPLKSMERYDVMNDEWETLPSMKLKRQAFSAEITAN
jgi:hypothetical protein